MKKTWNVMGKMAVCSFAAAMMVMIGTGSGMTAHAEMIIDSEEEIQAVQEIVPESENQDVLQADAPAAEVMPEMPEAGDAQINMADIDVSDIVVIEDSLIPGAALPDFGFEASEGEAEAPEMMEEAADAQEEAVPEENPETCISGVLTYEDDEVTVTVFASEAAQLPADTEVKVSRLEEGSEQYEAAKEAARASVAAEENASYAFYDVTLESEGRILDVAEGTVSVQMEFKTSGDAKKDVVKIEETESGKVARNVTDTAAERASSVALDY